MAIDRRDCLKGIVAAPAFLSLKFDSFISSLFKEELIAIQISTHYNLESIFYPGLEIIEDYYTDIYPTVELSLQFDSKEDHYQCQQQIKSWKELFDLEELDYNTDKIINYIKNNMIVQGNKLYLNNVEFVKQEDY